ncbi:hypothetical protein MYX07_00425 [Patescibacteria group bacterium AH-259-L07]|nr:hypothetical protein [Patescibacteria group bacterium AH-259-L07]
MALDLSAFGIKTKDPIEEKEPEIGKLNLSAFQIPQFLGGGEFRGRSTLQPSELEPFKTERGGLGTIEKREIRGGTFLETEKEVDHIIPLALGGTEDPHNLQALKNKKTITQTIFDAFTGKKRLPSDYKPKNRQEGKMVVEWKAINKYESGEISLAEARGAVINWEDPAIFLHEEREKLKPPIDIFDLFKKKEEPRFEIPITEEEKRRVVKPSLLPEPSIWKGNLPEFVKHSFKKQLQKERIYSWFIKTQPERNREIQTFAPLIFTYEGRNKLVEQGKITPEEAEIYSVIPEYLPVFTGMRQMGVKELTKMIGKASEYKSGQQFAEAIAKKFGTNVTEVNKGFAKFGMPNAQKLWEFATGRTTALTIPKRPIPGIKGKPPIITPPPAPVKPVLPVLPKIPVKPVSKITEKVKIPTIPSVGVKPEVKPVVPEEVRPLPKDIKRVEPEVRVTERELREVISKELRPLAEEVKKFKSPEEFIKKLKSIDDELVRLRSTIPTIEKRIQKLPKEDRFLAEVVAGEKLQPDIIRAFTEKFDVGEDALRRFFNLAKVIEFKPKVKPILKGLEPLAKEARKFKSSEEFVDFIEKSIVKRKIEVPVGMKGIPEVEREINRLQNIIRKNFVVDAKLSKSQLTDFYNQAVKEVKPIVKAKTKVKPKLKPEKVPIKAVSDFKNFINLKKIKTKDIPYKEMDIAERTTPKGNKLPAIRKTGFFATKDIEDAFVRDVYNQTLPPHLMALKQDGYKLGGKFGVIFRRIWKPTEKAIRNEKEFISSHSKLIRQLGKKHHIKPSEKNLKHLSDVIEGKVKATPKEEAYLKELRTVLDDLRNQANAVRRIMGKKEIGYIENYIPHIQKTALWSELLSNRATISDNLDFIIPNQAKNPFAYKRMFELLPDAERNLYILLDRYIRAISKDIYLAPAIENIKVYNSVLKNRELTNASRYWDEYIRTGLIGKQHKLDLSLSIGLKGRKVLQKWNNMVNLAFLTGKVAWNLATQPLSYIMNVPMETGIRNSIIAIGKSFNKSLREYVKINSNVLAIKSGDIRAIAIGEGRNIQNRIYKTKINHYNDFISMLGSIEERELTRASFIAGLERAKQLGLKGEDTIWFADLTAARTQSMYNKENRALILNSDIARTMFPFQSFSVEMFNHFKEISTKASGAMRLTYRQRFGKLFGLLVGLYLANLYSEALTGRKKTTIGTFVPFFGAYVDMLIAKGAGKEYYGGRSPITVIQILRDGLDGARDYIEHGSIKRLRKLALNFGLALGGIGGGGQINNIIDGIMANINEDVRNIKGDVMFEVKDAESKIKAPIFGIWATKEGKEYWLPKEKKKKPGLPKLPSLPKLPKLPNI